MPTPPSRSAQSGRSRDVDEQHETVLLDRCVIAAGDEIHEDARADQRRDAEAEVQHQRDRGGIGDADPEIPDRGLMRQAGDALADLEQLDGNDDDGVGRAAHRQKGGKGQPVESFRQPALEDKQFDPAEHHAGHERVGKPRDECSRRMTALREIDGDTRDDARDDDGAERAQLPLQPGVHAFRSGASVYPAP
ncbi:hypothetical protein [Bradyrhizobium sp. USDA 4451]